MPAAPVPLPLAAPVPLPLALPMPLPLALPMPVPLALPMPVPLALQMPLPGAPEVLTGVAAGVEVGGSDVNGVGSGGRGFERIPATNWSRPVVWSLFRYLYQVVRLSFQTVLGCAKLASVPAAATARA